MGSQKLITVALVAFVLVAGLAPLSAAGQEIEPGGSFIDDDGNVHEGYIEAIAAVGITTGCSTDRYCPGDFVSRGQMATFIARAKDLTPVADGPFSDVGGVHAPNINAIAQAGITAGCETGLYCPNDFVTRAQMATFLARAENLAPVADGPFSDVGGVHAPNINAIAQAGITAGCETGLYCPNDFVTRAQMATFLGRALGLEPIDVPPRPLPVPGNPDGNAPIPAGAGEMDTSNPDRVIGTGTPGSCTSQAVVDTIALGGIITFDCGPDPVTIGMTDTALIYNDTGPEIVVDGGGLVTLDGLDQRRILYMNTCDPALVWTTTRCDIQEFPRLTVQNLTFINGNSGSDQAGGGAIHVQGGQFQAVNSRFFSNVCATTGPDVGGAGVRLILMYPGASSYIINSTFGGSPDLGNQCSNGAAVSTLHASVAILNSYFSYNTATGWGANPAASGTPGGGNGGTLYADGLTMVMRLAGTLIENGTAPEGGAGVFFVSNNLTGNLIIEDSTIRTSPSGGFWTNPYLSIFYLGSGPIQVTNSTVQ